MVSVLYNQHRSMVSDYTSALQGIMYGCTQLHRRMSLKAVASQRSVPEHSACTVVKGDMQLLPG